MEGEGWWGKARQESRRDSGRKRTGDSGSVVKMEETEAGKLGRARERAMESLSARETDWETEQHRKRETG